MKNVVFDTIESIVVTNKLKNKDVNMNNNYNKSNENLIYINYNMYIFF